MDELDKNNQKNDGLYIDDNLDDKDKALAGGYFMAWQVDEKDPFEYFANKYGRKATQVGIGKKTQIELPDGVIKLDIQVPEGQVWLR